MVLLAVAATAQEPVAPFERGPLAADDTEGKILDVLADLDRNHRRGMMNVPMDDGRLLRLLTETMGAKHCDCPTTEFVVDAENKIVSTPAYMLGPGIKDVQAGIQTTIDELLKLI